MYCRRKLLLALLQQANNRLRKTNLQQILFLITQEQYKPCFDFVPYKDACFSFLANRELEILSNHYSLIDNLKKDWVLKDSKDYFSALYQKDQKIIANVLEDLDLQNITQLYVQKPI